MHGYFSGYEQHGLLPRHPVGILIENCGLHHHDRHQQQPVRLYDVEVPVPSPEQENGDEHPKEHTAVLSTAIRLDRNGQL